MRFEGETCSALDKSCWWELEPEEIMNFYGLMRDPAAFARAVMDGSRNGQS